MIMRRFIVSIYSAGLMILGAGLASGQNFPNKPIRIVTSGVGSGSDFSARFVAQGISGPLGQPVIVENRGGAVGPGEIVWKATPDGYTLMVDASSFWITPLLQKSPYDPITDFSPISLTNRSPLLLVVYPSLPAKSVKELIVLSKARPGELNYASQSTGGASHLAMELFKSMAGVNLVRVSYKVAAQAFNDLMGGQVEVAFNSGAAILPHVKSGRLRALAVTTAQPSALFPDLPTIAASGLPGYEAAQMSAVFAPAKTPQASIKRLNEEIARFLSMAEARQKLLNAGTEAVGSSPEQLSATMKSETARMGKVIKEAGIRAE